MIRPALTFLLVVSCFFLKAQQQTGEARELDSLRKAVSIASGIRKAETLVTLAKYYINTDFDSSALLMEQAVGVYSKEENDTSLFKSYIDFAKALKRQGKGEVALTYLSKAQHLPSHLTSAPNYQLLLYNQYGDVYYSYLTNFDSALHYYTKSLQVAKDSSDKAAALSNLGLTYNALDITVKALDQYLTALRYLEYPKDPRIKGRLYNNLGILYEDDGDNAKAEEYYKKATAIYKENHNFSNEFDLLNNLGILYDHQHRYEESLTTLHQAEVLLPELNDKLSKAILSLNFGNTLTHMGRPTEAIPKFESSRLIFIEVKDNYGVTLSHRQLAEAYYKAKKYREGEQNAMTAIKLAEQYGYTRLIKDAYHDLYDIYDATRQYEKAFRYQKLYMHLQDSISNKQRRSKIGLLEKEYELSRQENEKKALAEENEIRKAKEETDRISKIALAAFSGLFLIASIVAAFAYYRAKKKNDLLAEQKEKIERQSVQLKEAAENKARFFANVSHELRTPVTLINGMLELIHDYPGNERQEKMNIALANSRRLQNLVDEVLDLSRLESSKIVFHKKRTELFPLLKRIVFAFESLLLKKNIQLNFEADELSGIYIDLDEDKFEKIINNLLYNAIKFNRENGWIRVNGKILESGNKIVIQIIDSGIGIPEKDLPHIFDRFFQSKSTDHKNAQGIGIGLSLVKEFSALHDGRVSATSEQGHGSTFALEFPISKSDLPESELIIRTEEEYDVDKVSFVDFKKPPRVLIVEDHDEMRFYLKEILGNEIKFDEAENGKEALKWLKTNNPDLIIADVMMPEMDGYELLKQLKDSEAFKNIPVIMVTARASEEDLLYGLSLGVDDYIIKPFNAKELKIRIHNLLVNQQLRNTWKAKPVDADEKIASADDGAFLGKVQQFVTARIANALSGVPDLADHLAMSERQLYRKCGELTGMTPAQLIKEIKMKMAHSLLVNKQVTKISELASELGFDNSAYFSRQFYERFGKKPVDFL
jgi:signal transduction histidine kinase/CheY-like chemotaxis protein/AraC-like DNA-binding protein/Flp pilus assembly protein TadD